MPGNAAKSFEELHIYQRARELTNAVYAITREGVFARDFGLVNQLRRASVSVMSFTPFTPLFHRRIPPCFVPFLYF